MNSQASLTRSPRFRSSLLVLLGTWLPVTLPAGEVQAPAAPAEESDFVSLFNGVDLTGWEGDPQLWRVEQGAIVGQTVAANPIPGSSFLICTAGSFEDFELRLAVRVAGTVGKSNTGIQYRSRRLPERGRWVVGGYQADFDLANEYTGILYDAYGRGVMTVVGQRAVLTQLQPNADGTIPAPRYGRTLLEEFATPTELYSRIDPSEWNDYAIIARGNHFQHRINGQLMVDVRDDDVSQRHDRGLIGFQLHDGPPMRVEYKQIRIRKLTK